MSKKPDNNNVERVFDGGKRKMEVITKILIALAGVGVVAGIAYGVSSLDAAKQAETMQAASVVQIEANEFKEKTQVEQVVDNTIKEVDYSKEAEQAFVKSGLSAEYKEQFIQAYIKFRNQGVSANDIIKKLSEQYKKEETSEVMGNAAGDQAEIEDEYDQAYQDQLDAEAKEAEIVEEVEQPEFQVLLLDETVKYAKQNVNVRKGPSTTYDKIGSLTTNQEVTVIGLVPDSGSGWYQLIDENDEIIGYVSASYLVDEKVTVQEAKPPVQESTPEQSAPQSENSPTGAGTTAPSGAKVGRGNVSRGNGAVTGGSGRGDNATYH